MASVKLTKKQQAEYDILRERFRISKKAYKEYYDEVRKANRKLRDLNRKGKLITNYGAYTTKIDSIKTRSDFNKRMSKIRKIRQRDFRKEYNKYRRETFKKSFYDVFSSDNLTQQEIDELNKLVDELGDDEIKSFIDNNPELLPWFKKYVEIKVKKNISELSEIDKQTLMNRLRYMKNRKK